MYYILVDTEPFTIDKKEFSKKFPHLDKCAWTEEVCTICLGSNDIKEIENAIKILEQQHLKNPAITAKNHAQYHTWYTLHVYGTKALAIKEYPELK
jgi:hypothetical protein